MNHNLKDFSKNYIQGTHIDVFGQFDTELHPGKYFLHLYNELFHTYSIYATIDLEPFLQEINEKFKITPDNYILREEQSNNKKIDKIDYSSSTYIILIKPKIILEVSSYKAVFWYGHSVQLSEIHEIIKIIETAKRKKRHNRKFYMVASSGRSEYGFEFKKFNIKKIKLNIEENYNDDFIPVNETITSFLKENRKNGLVLLHGKYGTGKTTYIRHIMSVINRRFIFLPVSLMEAVSSPSFLPFISKYKDSILVLEDCEDILLPRGNGSHNNNSLINLLNLGDGLLSDALSFKIICTFNANIKQIDQAILRKGRLVARYEFKELEVPKAQQIIHKLGQNDTINKPMNLAEIYNRNSENYSEIGNAKKLGFN